MSLNNLAMMMCCVQGALSKSILQAAGDNIQQECKQAGMCMARLAVCLLRVFADGRMDELISCIVIRIDSTTVTLVAYKQCVEYPE